MKRRPRNANLRAINPALRSLSRREVNQDIRDFVELLDMGSAEHRIHESLANHSYFFSRLLRLNGNSPLYSKVRLGDQFEIDFVCFDSGSSGPEWYWIEIECPSSRLFTRAGRMSAPLTHTIQQMRDWHTWLHDTLGFARKLMPHIDYPLGYIFMGRRNDLHESWRKHLSANRKLTAGTRLQGQMQRMHVLQNLFGSAIAILFWAEKQRAQLDTARIHLLGSVLRGNAALRSILPT
jgi:hypothetical protein